MRVAGWRTLLDGRCQGCGHRYVQDLPAGHGLIYPATIDIDTGELLDPWGGGWFARWLFESWERPDGQPVELEIRGDASGRPAVLLDCLDPVYGHAVLKLLNASRHLDTGERALIVLVPQALEALVPAETSETWIVREGFDRLDGWLLELEERLARELDRIGDCTLSPAYPHPHPSTYEIARHVEGIEPERPGSPLVVLALRDDRAWGADRSTQRANVAALSTLLEERLAPGSAVAAIGVSEPGGLPANVSDLRDPAPDLATERRWLALARGADLAIGVHGSHLLVPSGLAKATIELLPQTRFSNALQATLVSQRDPVLALAAHRTLPGGPDLADVTPERVAELAAAVLAGAERLPLLMSGPAAGVGEGPTTIPTRDPYREGAPPADVSSAAIAAAAARAAAARAAQLAGSALAGRRGRRASVPAVVTDSSGARFELESAEELDAFGRHGGHFERAEMDVAGRCLSEGMVAVDVGANIGAFTTVLSRAVGPRGAVHAFEPLPVARRRLERTIELNELTNVTVLDAAASNVEGAAELHVYGPGYESWSSLGGRSIEQEGTTLRPAEGITVPTTTLDVYADRTGIERIHLLKIDVEGAEGLVLEGAEGLLAAGRIDSLLVELADTTLAELGSRAVGLLELLEGYGLRPHVAEGGGLRPIRIAGRLDRLLNVVALSPVARTRVADLLT